MDCSRKDCNECELAIAEECPINHSPKKKRCKLFHRWKYTYDEHGSPVQRVCKKCDLEQHYTMTNRPFLPTGFQDIEVIKRGDYPFTVYDFYNGESYH